MTPAQLTFLAVLAAIVLASAVVCVPAWMQHRRNAWDRHVAQAMAAARGVVL